ncbi:MAG: YceI family protein [Bacteroidia bacterium]|nr:YceI family protein [Bacteroidia bacterium]NNJ56050.1 YceI family protein [Bacteroidia bacterium]
MKRANRTIKPLLMVVFLTISLLAGSSKSVRLNYSIDDSSKLILSGTSNVSDYQCDCNELIQTEKEVLFEVCNDTFTFTNALLELKTKSFDCGLGIITGEMHSALKAKRHPKITVQLLSVDLSNNTNFLADQNKSYTTSGKAKITIAGNSKVVNLIIKAKKLSNQQYHFSGTKHLKMTDFNIVPPTPAMGLIRVANEVEIELDLKARTLL